MEDICRAQSCPHQQSGAHQHVAGRVTFALDGFEEWAAEFLDDIAADWDL